MHQCCVTRRLRGVWHTRARPRHACNESCHTTLCCGVCADHARLLLVRLGFRRALSVRVCRRAAGVVGQCGLDATVMSRSFVLVLWAVVVTACESSLQFIALYPTLLVRFVLKCSLNLLFSALIRSRAPCQKSRHSLSSAIAPLAQARSLRRMQPLQRSVHSQRRPD